MEDPEVKDPGDQPAWIETVDDGEATGDLERVYRRSKGERGVAHILKVQSLHPKALEAHLSLYRRLMFGPSPLSRAERESIAVVVSVANECFY